ncbi:hypothetical protein RI129_006236 [Pyrocoelia pectoralis]|uniref:Uncharacterized protein n=1 Tax=Pyrocoelia pectoralis TaxID=417401 RepID=A0AAN7VG32_9COLE
MDRYHINILGISECRWTGYGECKTEEHSFIYSGLEEGSEHRYGVGIIFKKKNKRTVGGMETG